MKDAILVKLQGINSMEERFNVLREFLQCLVLKFIEEKGYMRNIAFVGGTALRFLYELERFSEDLDFSLISKENFDFSVFSSDLKNSLKQWNIDAEVKNKEIRTVKSSLIKFSGLLYEGGISVRENQKLLIKLEVDCNPPIGFKTQTSFNQKYLPVNLLHYEIGSLFAGKLHAVLQRQYTKGRDFYDLMWFLSKKIEPNYVQLENALYQTTGKKFEMNKEVLKSELKDRIARVDFDIVHEELSRFLMNKDNVKYVNLQNLLQLIEAF